MGIAMFSFGGLLAPLQAMVGWFAPQPAAIRNARPLRPAVVRTRPGIPAQCRRAVRPLRVFRVADESHAPAAAARMVISGRMEDVCAELDRLASLEAATR